MAIEIERKFLVRNDTWRSDGGVLVVQGYLNRQAKQTVRIRVTGEKAFISVKSTTIGATRAEFEYEIPVSDGRELLNLCDGQLIEKTRHTVAHAGMAWEVDEFHGANAGLVIAEVELESEEQPFDKPPWLGAEVTDDPRYFNANLAARPYSRWHEL